jgi:drug/metabolite transporter (DMT)-like permease
MRTETASRSSANRRGIVAMIGSTALFSANDAATKVAAKTIPATEIMAIRGIFTVLFILLIIGWRGEFGQMRQLLRPLVFVRSGAEALVGFLLIAALALMPIADVTAILLIQPFLLTIAGVLLFKENVGWRRWSAVAAGFVGMLLVVKPGTGAFQTASLIVLGAAFLVVVRDVTTRLLHAEVPTTGVVLVTAIFGVLIGAAGTFGGNWKMPGIEAFVASVIAGAFLVFAIILGVIAFREADVSVVAPFRYALVVFAVIYGVFIFAEFPDTLSLAGIGLIVGAGLYMLHRQTVRHRQMSAAEARAIAAGEPPL